MPAKGGYVIAKVANIPWEDRVNVDGWPSRGGLYYDVPQYELCMRLIDYPVGSTEPRHVHAGMHATTVLEGVAIVDGVTLKPLDVVLGPSNEPHGPLHYPRGCKLFSAFQGSYYHSEVGELSGEKHYRLIQADTIPWSKEDGREAKTLVDRGLGRLLLQAVRYPAGSVLERPRMLAALLVGGSAKIEDERLGAWDFFYVRRGADHEPVRFESDTTLLEVTMR
jgi:hypothetical protein